MAESCLSPRRLQRGNATAWTFGYDALGQLTAARQSLLRDGTAFAGRDFGYTFDDIGNRVAATRTTGAGARTSTYTPDLLNRYEQRTVPGVAEVLGGAALGSTVTLDSTATGAAIHFTDRDGESFRGEVPVDNTAAAQYPGITVTAEKNNAGPLGEDAVATLTRSALVPKTPEIFTHDADGNLTSDGQWSYSWDAENRLIAVETLPALVVPSGPLPADRKRRVEYRYDAQHRRIARKAYSWNATTSAWQLTSDIRYLYDGWNVIADFGYDFSNSTFNLNASYAWALDLSGTREGAGGIGGLLFARLHNGASSVTHAAAADANGNILAYYAAATGGRTARFEYGPFGEPLVADGQAAEQLNYRFSTKPRDPLTGTYYYGYRWYAPTTGRFLSRDPINEPGSQLTRIYVSEGNLIEESNLYRFSGSDPSNRFDPWGLAYFAYRPLDSKGGRFIGVVGSKLDESANTMTAHEQLFFEDGKSPGNLGFFDDNSVRSDKSSLKYKNAHDTGWSDCVMRKAVSNVRPTPYCLLGKIGKTEKYNCQDWADAVRSEYRRLMKDPSVIASCCPTDSEKKK